MKSRDCILTFDIGTTGNKCSIFDSKGSNLATVTISYKTYYPQPGWAEQDPEDYWNSVISGITLLYKNSPALIGRIAGIGLSGHMNGMLPVDKRGDPVFREIIHSDNRSESICREIREEIPDYEFFQITGNRIDSHLSLSKILWFRREYPELYRKTAFILQSKDFIAGRLTGVYGCTDYSDASLTCLLDINHKTWSDRILTAFNLDLGKLPVLLRSHEKVGGLSVQSAGLLGLPSGLPVFAGGGDASCSARGAGIGDFKTAQNYIGSSSWISLLSPKPLLDRGMRIQNFFDLDGESYNVCGTVQCAGIALDWMIDELGGIVSGEGRDYLSIESAAAHSAPGADGIFFLPYLMGERTPHWNQNLKGCFLGLSLSHGRNDMVRSVFEGIAMALRDVLEVFEDNGLPVDTLSLTGGGAVSLFWNQMMSDIYNKPVKVPLNPKQATSLGAAISVAVGLEIFPSYTEAVKQISFERVLEPQKGVSTQYEVMFSVYRSLYQPVASLCDSISEYQRGLFNK